MASSSSRSAGQKRPHGPNDERVYSLDEDDDLVPHTASSSVVPAPKRPRFLQIHDTPHSMVHWPRNDVQETMESMIQTLELAEAAQQVQESHSSKDIQWVGRYNFQYRAGKISPPALEPSLCARIQRIASAAFKRLMTCKGLYSDKWFADLAIGTHAMVRVGQIPTRVLDALRKEAPRAALPYHVFHLSWMVGTDRLSYEEAHRLLQKAVTENEEELMVVEVNPHDTAFVELHTSMGFNERHPCKNGSLLLVRVSSNPCSDPVRFWNQTPYPSDKELLQFVFRKDPPGSWQQLYRLCGSCPDSEARVSASGVLCFAPAQSNHNMLRLARQHAPPGVTIPTNALIEIGYWGAPEAFDSLLAAFLEDRGKQHYVLMFAGVEDRIRIQALRSEGFQQFVPVQGQDQYLAVRSPTGELMQIFGAVGWEDRVFVEGQQKTTAFFYMSARTPDEVDELNAMMQGSAEHAQTLVLRMDTQHSNDVENMLIANGPYEMERLHELRLELENTLLDYLPTRNLIKCLTALKMPHLHTLYLDLEHCGHGWRSDEAKKLIRNLRVLNAPHWVISLGLSRRVDGYWLAGLMQYIEKKHEDRHPVQSVRFTRFRAHDDLLLELHEVRKGALTPLIEFDAKSIFIADPKTGVRVDRFRSPPGPESFPDPPAVEWDDETGAPISPRAAEPSSGLRDFGRIGSDALSLATAHLSASERRHLAQTAKPMRQLVVARPAAPKAEGGTRPRIPIGNIREWNTHFLRQENSPGFRWVTGTFAGGDLTAIHHVMTDPPGDRIQLFSGSEHFNQLVFVVNMGENYHAHRGAHTIENMVENERARLQDETTAFRNSPAVFIQTHTVTIDLKFPPNIFYQAAYYPDLFAFLRDIDAPAAHTVVIRVRSNETSFVFGGFLHELHQANVPLIQRAHTLVFESDAGGNNPLSPVPEPAAVHLFDQPHREDGKQRTLRLRYFHADSTYLRELVETRPADGRMEVKLDTETLTIERVMREEGQVAMRVEFMLPA